MRGAVIGALMLGSLAGAVLTAALSPREGYAQRAGLPVSSRSGLITHALSAGDSRQVLTVIDPELRTMCVYHVEASSGQITLKSVRNFHWDLQMLEFNSTNPQPREIRSLVEQH